MTSRAHWLADVLRRAGLNVVEVQGWRDRGSPFTDLDAIVWHHDGSPAGASPNVPLYMARQIDQGKPGAQCWVALNGTWHLVASGKVFHTGEVRSGKPGNSRALGVETDHTLAERWPPAQLDSLRRGTAAILRQLGEGVDRLEFHKTICSPPGRKTDPDGLDLDVERKAVAALLAPVIQPEEDPMALTCIPTTAKRLPNARFPFYRLDPAQGLVLAYNGAKLRKTDGAVFGIVPFMRLPSLNGKPIGICEAEDGSVVVVCEDGGTVDAV